MQVIAIGNDHKGALLKKGIVAFLKKNYKIMDCGSGSSTDRVDYPDFAKKVATAISTKKAMAGILICHTGIGMSIVANRIKNIRAALCYTAEHAKLARLHNDANILVLGSRFISEEEAFSAVMNFLTTEFEEGRHIKRLQKIENL
ncbi:MAG: ribose 5-phosphate isomerase B [Rickettsiales bacterium]|nr:ribose 5-phosphate isomerase B [Rickettsiales bacterium]